MEVTGRTDGGKTSEEPEASGTSERPEVPDLLRVENLWKEFHRGRQTVLAVDHVGFSIRAGECFGLVGVSGCGKSTTASLIARLLRESGGTIVFEGRQLTGRGPGLQRAGKGLQMIFQNPLDSFDPRDTVLQGVMQGAASRHMFSRAELRERALELFGQVGLKEEYAGRPMTELSGGECQRAAIARALICEPRLLICDEATSALDMLVQAQIIALLRRLQKERNMSLLFITHDLPLAGALCDRIAVMDRGRIVETGPAWSVLHSPQTEQTRLLIDAILTPDSLRSGVLQTEKTERTRKPPL